MQPLEIRIDDGAWNQCGKVVKTYTHYDINSRNLNIVGDLIFVEDKYSKSHRGAVRGFHGDNHTWKLVTCLNGLIYLAVIDARRSSQTYRKTWTYTLCEEKNNQILIPPGFVNAHQSLKDDSLFFYKQTSYYMGTKAQVTVNPLSFSWPIKDIIVSDRDRSAGEFDSIDIESLGKV